MREYAAAQEKVSFYLTDMRALPGAAGDQVLFSDVILFEDADLRIRQVIPRTGIVSEGQFSGGFLEGQGWEFYADGTLLREGVFPRGLLEGEGCEYSLEGVLLREGAFSAGLLHGDGREYTSGGKLQYEGQFWRGLRHGQGDLYDTPLDVRSASGAFVYGELTGQGTLYNPSGQPLYTGQVCDGRPKADAFLGLSLAEVEEAFLTHWLLYSCEGATAFVYPYFNLMFITESPVELVSLSQMEEAAQQERQELLDALKPPASETDGSPDAGEEAYSMTGDAPVPAEPSQPPVYEDPDCLLALHFLLYANRKVPFDSMSAVDEMVLLEAAIRAVAGMLFKRRNKIHIAKLYS